MIPYGRQTIDEADIQAATEVLKSTHLTQGPKVPEFERAVTSFTDSEYAVACSSATAALHLACLALNVQAGDIVWTSAMTFLASANCARYCGATVDFVDIEETTGNLSVSCLQEKLAAAEKTGQLPKLVIPVHYTGNSCDMEQIKHLADKYGFFVVEDASHALGGAYQGKQVGSCQYSDMAVFSFHPVKMITTGEGGLITTNNPDLFAKLGLLRSHGVTKQPASFVKPNPEPWEYEQQHLGYNYRLTDLQAALGISQLQHLQAWVKQRRDIYYAYKAELADLPIEFLDQTKEAESSLHIAVIKVPASKRRELYDYLHANGIGCQVHYVPVYQQPYYQKLLGAGFSLPHTEKFYEQILTLPLFPALSKADQGQVIKTVREFF